jgi:hypothetical protein
MARTEMPNATLYAVAIGLQQLQQINPAIAFLLKEKINRFFQQNAMLLKIIDSRRSELVKKYVKHDELGNAVTKKDEETKIEQYVFEDEKTEEEYKNAYEEFMSRYVNVES